MKFRSLKETILREVKKLNPASEKPLTKILEKLDKEKNSK